MKATAIGERAGRILATGGPARVIGLTSRGVFLVNESGEIVFVSFEHWHGPLTINLAGHESWDYPPSFNNIQMEEIVELRPDRIGFTRAKIGITLSPSTGWKAELPAREIEPGVPARLRAVTTQLLESGPPKGWNSLLLEWAGVAPGRDLPDPLSEINRNIVELKSGLSAGDEEGAVAGIRQLLGKGAGLTPSGDDLVIGLLLASSRYSGICSAIFRSQAWIQRIIGLARQKTTWLGACLVESAAEGQADERLVIALDGVVTGNPDAVESADRLLAYGSSSGGDALLGMALALR